MSGFLMLNLIACAYISIWAAWCVLSKHVDDGIVGKVFYTFVAFAALSAANTEPTRSEVLFHCSIALLSLRHQFMRQILPRIQHLIPKLPTIETHDHRLQWPHLKEKKDK